MNDADHFRRYPTFLNHSFSGRFDYDPLESFEPALSIHENCSHGEAVGLSATGFAIETRRSSALRGEEDFDNAT